MLALIKARWVMVLWHLRMTNMWDIWDIFLKSVPRLLTGLQKVAPIGLASCLVGAGFLFLIGRKASDTAKGWLLYIVFGGILFFGAISVAGWV